MQVKPIASFCLFLSFAFSFAALVAEAGDGRAYLSRDNYGAPLEPIDGVYTGAGQDPAGYDGYLRALGDGKAPVIYMFYTGLRWNVEADLARLAAEMAAAEARTGTYGIAQIGLSMTTDGTPEAHYEADVAAGKYDDAIDSLCRGIRDLGHPVIVRIGYEFNGTAWNGYESDSYKAAFRRVTEKLRAYRLECATCWDASATAGTMGSVMDFYPGDEWVDWWGINLFLPSEFADPAVERFMTEARAHGKPVLIGESTPRGVGTRKGKSSWNAWFAKYFSFIGAHPGVKAFSYINWDFAKYPQWSDWGDARLEKNREVADRFAGEVSLPPFILGRNEMELRRSFGETYDPSRVVPPTAPVGLRASAVAGGVALSWNDDASVRRWTVLRGGVAVASTGTASFLDRAVGAGESVSYSAIARGKSGMDSPACPAVAVTLPDAVEKAVNGGFDGALAPWALNRYSGAEATIELDPSGALGAGSSAKVTVRKGATDWFVQLSQPVMTRAGRGYYLTLTAKADRPCSVEAFIQEAHEPYAALASRRLPLTREPQTFTLRVTASANDDRMNLAVMLGGNAGRTVWIDSVSLVESK